MKRWTLAEITAQAMKNRDLDSNLVLTKEFELLADYLYEPEVVLHLVVCGLEGLPYLVVLTNQRVFLIQKIEWNGAKILQLGLEEILDLETQESGSNTDLILTLTSRFKYKLTNIPTALAYEFGQVAIQALKNWKQEIV